MHNSFNVSLWQEMSLAGVPIWGATWLKTIYPLIGLPKQTNLVVQLTGDVFGACS